MKTNKQKSALFKTSPNYKWCMVLLDTSRDEVTRLNTPRCAVRFSPCSTFKIVNSLIGLETEVIAGQNHRIEWNGTRYSNESWNRDHTLASAMPNSVLWYHMALAARVGRERMREYLRRFEYGNEDITGWDDPFWLASSLAISANEQVAFLKRLNDGLLPISARSMEIVQNITILDETPERIYRGKTGSDGKGLGWFVGSVTSDEKTVIFAFNITKEGINGFNAREMAESTLMSKGILS
ncbi:MAG: class D beta-lactamase [Anaerolineales bacterium]|nr:class D beta-lactamase [Anaerolineales bacterium]